LSDDGSRSAAFRVGFAPPGRGAGRIIRATFAASPDRGTEEVRGRGGTVSSA